MYSFEPSEEQAMLVDAVSRFANNDLRPKAHDAEEEGHFEESLIQKGWELGLLQASIPEQYGGFGEHSALTGVLAVESMTYGDMAGTLAILTPSLFCIPILLCGNEEQKCKYLPTVIEGDWLPYTAALVEPSFDFDANQLKTLAVEDGDGFRLSGQKVFVPFAKESPAMIIYANLNNKTQGFIVPSDTEGLEIADRQKLLGINALPVYHINIQDIKVTKENRLGGDEGHDIKSILDTSYLALSAMGLGLSRAAFDYSRDYAKDRDVFGVKVAQKQAIAFMLAEMATEIEAIRLLTWEAAWMKDASKDEASKQAYLAYTGATDLAMMVTDRAVQILGGHGYIREHPVELWMRNGRGISTMLGMAVV